MHNIIDAQLSDADKAEIAAAVQVIKDKLPFLQGASDASNKNKGWVMSVKARVFCDKLMNNSSQLSPYLSPSTDLAAYQRDCALKNDIHQILISINALQGTVENTYAVLQTETAQQGLYIYKQLKIASTVGEGNKNFVAELQALMPGNGKRKKKEEEWKT